MRRPSPRDIRSGKSSPIFCFCSRSVCIRGLSWNGPAWSAALEFYVSILFAVVVLLFPRRKYDVFLGLCVAAGALLYTVSPDTLFVSYRLGHAAGLLQLLRGLPGV